VSTSGAQPGNKNASKGKPWRDAIERALAHEHGNVQEGLRKIAAKVVAAASEGDREAWQEIGNRMDGKPHQSTDVSMTASLQVVALDKSDAGLL